MASTGDLSGKDDAAEGGGSNETEQLEATIASLTKQNTKLKNELRFTTETERWAGLLDTSAIACRDEMLFTYMCTGGHLESISQTFREI